MKDTKGEPIERRPEDYEAAGWLKTKLVPQNAKLVREYEVPEGVHALIVLMAELAKAEQMLNTQKNEPPAKENSSNQESGERKEDR